MLVLLWLLDSMLVLFFSFSFFALYNWNEQMIKQETQNYQKNNIIFYTKTYWPWTVWNYCLDKFDYNFYTCDYTKFKNNRKFVTILDNEENTNNSKLFYKIDNNVIKETTIK